MENVWFGIFKVRMESGGIIGMTNKYIHKKLDAIQQLIFGIYARNSDLIAKSLSEYSNIKFELEQKQGKEND